MAKRQREETRNVLVSGIYSGVDIREVALFFSQCGRIKSYWSNGKNQCVIQFDSLVSAELSCSFDGKIIPELSYSNISVIIEEDSPRKKQKFPCSSSFAVIDTPRFNNYFIPILPLSLSTNKLK